MILIVLMKSLRVNLLKNCHVDPISGQVEAYIKEAFSEITFLNNNLC